MCENKAHIEVKQEKKYRLADFFDRWWDIYNQNPKEYIYPEQYKAVNAIRTCRTAALGVDIYACPSCGEISEVYHSCKNRFCPTCSWNDTVRWADRLKRSMLNVPHRHVVFTLPHQLNPLIKRNNKEILNILMRVTADVFKDWIGHKYNLDIGVISVLHTFGEVKNYHPHMHMIISWGGINRKTKLLEAIKSDFVNYPYLQKKFRCKFEDSLVTLYDSGLLEHGFKDRISFLKFLKGVNSKHWVLHLEPPMEIPTAVIRYIGRYSKRACLSEYKITSMEGENIKFRYKDYADKDFNGQPKEKELELSYYDFIPRLLQHVPLPYFRIVRYYGLYSNKACIPKGYLYKETEIELEPEWEIEEDPKYCYRCRREKEYQFTEVKKRIKEKLWKPEKIEENEAFIYKRNVA
jgi:hypothetical protein